MLYKLKVRVYCNLFKSSRNFVNASKSISCVSIYHAEECVETNIQHRFIWLEKKKPAKLNWILIFFVSYIMMEWNSSCHYNNKWFKRNVDISVKFNHKNNWYEPILPIHWTLGICFHIHMKLIIEHEICACGLNVKI